MNCKTIEKEDGEWEMVWDGAGPNIETLSARQLRDYCKFLNLDTKGTKRHLITRITEFLKY